MAGGPRAEDHLQAELPAADEKPLMPKGISMCAPPLLSGWTGHGDQPRVMLALRSSLTPFRRGDTHSPSWLISIFPEPSAPPDAQ